MLPTFCWLVKSSWLPVRLPIFPTYPAYPNTSSCGPLVGSGDLTPPPVTGGVDGVMGAVVSTGEDFRVGAASPRLPSIPDFHAYQAPPISNSGTINPPPSDFAMFVV